MNIDYDNYKINNMSDRKLRKLQKGLPEWNGPPITLDNILARRKSKIKSFISWFGLIFALGALYYFGKAKVSRIEENILAQEKQNLERIVNVVDGKTLRVQKLREEHSRKMMLSEIIDTTGLDYETKKMLNEEITLKPNIIDVIYPLDNFYVSSKYGWRKIDKKIQVAYENIGGNMQRGEMVFHHGVDLATRLYSPVKSPIDGVVKRVGKNKGLGYFVDIYARDSLHEIKIRLAHLTFGRPEGKRVKWLHIKKGKEVKEGQVVGYVGLTGATTGPHVHEELWVKTERGWHDYDPLKGYGHHLYALHKKKDEKKQIYKSTLNTAKGIVNSIRKIKGNYTLRKKMFYDK